MRKIAAIVSILTVGVASLCGSALAQSTRSYVNRGVTLYKDGKFVDSEVQFKKGLEQSPKNFQATFNLGDSYYKQGNYSDALKAYQAALASAGKSDRLKSKVYHNIGNALLKNQKIKESIQAYADALKLNPDDMSTKYNLSYALDMLKDQKNQDKNNKNNDKKNQNKNQDKQNQKNRNDNQNKNQNRQNNQQQNQPQQMQNQMSKAQAQAIFSALNQDEQKLQKKLRKFEGKPTKIAKDW